MIGFLHSMCMIYRPKDMELGVAMYMCRRESTKGKVEVKKNYFCLGGMYPQYRHNFYLLYRNMFSPNYHLNDIHTISSYEML